MGRVRRGFMWISIVVEISLVMGVGLYGLIRPDSQVNEGGLISSTEADFSLSTQKEEIITVKEPSPAGKGGPYTVAPFLHTSLYRAKNGDNLWKIAQRNDLDFYTILSVNRMKTANEISVGQKVKIPNQRGILRTVRKGEAFEDIALEYNVDIRKIIRVNQILDPNDIKAGLDLFIPGARVSQAFSTELLANSGIPALFAWPCRRTRMTSGYGYRRDPFTGNRAFHGGMDFTPGYGANVYASMSGVVSYAGWMGGYGKLVVIDHRNSYSTRYGHLSRISVSRGDRIRQGQRLGSVGNTGRSTGAHLHFEIRKYGKLENPKKFIRR